MRGNMEGQSKSSHTGDELTKLAIPASSTALLLAEGRLE